jgi:hypothetical protein
MGLISLIGIKDAVYGGIIILLLSTGTVLWIKHDHKLIAEGEEKVVAAQQAADAKEAAHVKKVQDNANASLQTLQSRVDAEDLAPVQPHVVVRLCNSASSVPADAARGNASAGAQANATGGSGSGVGEGSDIAPATEAILKRDKDDIEYLQGYIRDCQAAGLCAK